MPDFVIEGNAAGIRSRAATTREKGSSFVSTDDALAKVTADGWVGRDRCLRWYYDAGYLDEFRPENAP